MKNCRWIIVGLVLVMIACAGCKKGENEGNGEAQAEGPVIPDIDWEEKIWSETIMEETKTEKAVAKVIELTVDEVTETGVTVTISSPDIGDALVTWFENITDNTNLETDLEEETLRLLKDTEAEALQVTLPYLVDVTGEVDIQYSNAFMNKVFCGMDVFYYYITNQAIEDLKENADETR